MKRHQGKLIEQSQRIIKALEEVIGEQGVNGINVNLIAKKSGVSKGIIYRNYGGEAGLLMYYAHSSAAFPHLATNHLEPLSDQNQERVSQSLFRQMFQTFRELRCSKASRQIIKAIVIGDHSLVDFISHTHESKLAEAVQQLPLPKGTDKQAVMAILLGGMYYVTLMAHNNQSVLGIDARSDSGWLRIEQAFRNFYNQLSNPVSQTQELKKLPKLINSDLVNS